MNRVYIGCDPGKSGALAFISGDCVRIYPFDEDAYRDELALTKEIDCVCCLERVSAMPKQGVTSMFNFGQNYGFIQGLLYANKVPFQLVTPKIWKRDFGLTDEKNKSIEVCKRLFPGVSLLRTERCRKDDDGMAEALLMAEYARRHF